MKKNPLNSTYIKSTGYLWSDGVMNLLNHVAKKIHFRRVWYVFRRATSIRDKKISKPHVFAALSRCCALLIRIHTFSVVICDVNFLKKKNFIHVTLKCKLKDFSYLSWYFNIKKNNFVPMLPIRSVILTNSILMFSSVRKNVDVMFWNILKNSM